MQVLFQGIFQTGNQPFDTDIRDLEIIETDAGVLLCASNGRNGGLSLFELDTSGEGVFTDFQYHGNATLFSGSLCVQGSGPDAWFVLEDTASSQLTFHTAAPNGTISTLTGGSLPGAEAGGFSEVAVADLTGGTSALYTISALTGAIEAWDVDPENGAMQQIQLTGSSADFTHLAASDMVVATRGTAQLLLVADGAVGGITSYVIDEDQGSLQPAGSLTATEGISVSGPEILSTFSAFGTTWVVLASPNSSSLSLIEAAADGSLILHDHLTDTLHTRFGGVQAVDVVTAMGHTFVLAAGSDDGLSLFQLLSDGRLLHAVSLPNQNGGGLENVTAIESVVHGASLNIYVAAEGSQGIAHYALDLADLGLSTIGSSAVETLLGSAGDDVLLAGAGGDTVIGGAGDDTLAADASGVLTGGSGRDTFVIGPDQGQALIEITDFDPGSDRLDLSAFAALRSVGQLEATALNGGIILSFQDTTIRMETSDGSSLTIADIWPAGFQGAHHWRPGISETGDWHFGTVEADMLTGTSGTDAIDGLDGNDVITGAGGADALSGGAGNDTLLGSGGWDTLLGGYGADSINGGNGLDSLQGGLGDDTLSGDGGVDTLEGGWGNDQLLGKNGKDLLFGEQGADQLYGNRGEDSLWGGDGADLLKGGDGLDLLNGGAGDDSLYGGRHRDVLQGGEGDDALRGGDANDMLSGDTGRDSLYGGNGKDTMDGGEGDDALSGNNGADFLFGGTGEDSLEGGSGADFLSGGSGNDILTGGSGADVFVFSAQHGSDRVTDFTSGADLIDLSALAIDLSEVVIQNIGADVLLTTEAGTILLEEMQADGLSSSDFIF